MTRQGLGIVSILLIAVMLIAALVLGASLPVDLRLPVHWNMAGEADAFADKWIALLAPPGMTAVLSLIFYALPALEPRRQGLARSQGLYLWGWLSILLVCAVIEIAVAAAALSWNLATDDLILATIGLILVLIGNQLGKSRSMYLIGIRTPWTLASEDVWIRTHRLGGKLMIVAGLAMIAAAFLPLSGRASVGVSIAAVVIAALVPIVYSYLLWRQERRGDQQSG